MACLSKRGTLGAIRFVSRQSERRQLFNTALKAGLRTGIPTAERAQSSKGALAAFKRDDSSYIQRYMRVSGDLALTADGPFCVLVHYLIGVDLGDRHGY